MLNRSFLLLLSFVFLAEGVSAAIPPETKKELAELTKELKDVTSLIKKKEVDKAKELIRKAEDRVKELAIADDEKDRSWTTFKTALERAKYQIPVSFEREVAPILTANCVRCHGAEQQACNLRVDTFAGIAQGGMSGQIVIPRIPNRSLLALRLATPDDMKRMPRGGAKLKDEEILTVVRWIEQGAAFDGKDPAAKIGDSLIEKKPPVKVVMADGSETVSFKNDVAPWLVNICTGCHSGNNPRGNYSLVTFEQLLQGGPTGNTIVPGKPDESYIVDLVLRQEPLKMPAGQAQLKRSQATALETWIREGAKFDGTDPKAPIRTLVPTDEELEAARLANMTDAEFEKRRVEQAAALWKRVSPRSEGVSATTDNFYMYGTVSEDRLKELGTKAETHLAELAKKYPLAGGQKAFRGRLIIFATKDRFDYEEFNTVLMNRRTPKVISGHSTINGNFETAYIAMHDVGDTASDSSLNAEQLMNSLISQSYLGRDGSALPDWLKQGFGMLEAGIPADSEYLKTLPSRATKAVATVNDPAKFFADGTFAPEEVGDVGYLLVRFLMTQGGPARFQTLIAELRKNPNATQVLQQVYQTPVAQLGQLFIRTGG